MKFKAWLGSLFLLFVSQFLSNCGVLFCREITGTKYVIRLTLRAAADTTASIDSSISLYFAPYGDALFDSQGNIKYNHSAVHPAANGVFDFKENTPNYTECTSEPGISSLGPISILIRGGKYKDDTVRVSEQDLKQLPSEAGHYNLPVAMLKLK